MSLLQIIYVSHAPEELDTKALDTILEAAVRHNRERNITGMLLYANGSFMQVLEGEVEAVEETYSRIAKDPRHSSVIVLDRSPIKARAFDRWCMGFRRLDVRDAQQNPDYAPFFESGFDVATLGARPGLALELLSLFRENQRG